MTVRQRQLESGVEYAVTGIRIAGANAAESSHQLVNSLFEAVEIALAQAYARRFGVPAAACSPYLATTAIVADYKVTFAALDSIGQVLALQRALAAANHPIELTGVLDAATINAVAARGLNADDLADATIKIIDTVPTIDAATFKRYAATANSAGEIVLQTTGNRAMTISINGTSVDAGPAWSVSEGPAKLHVAIYPTFLREIETYVIGGQRKLIQIDDAPQSAWVTFSASAPTAVTVDGLNIGNAAVGTSVKAPISAGRRVIGCGQKKPKSITVIPNQEIHVAC